MTMNLYIGSLLGAKKLSVTANSGLSLPSVISAIAMDHSRIRVLFDREMQRDISGMSLWPAALLHPSNYSIVNQATGEELPVVRVKRISDLEVELLTSHQTEDLYQLSVKAIEDQWGNSINPVFNTALFSGSAPTFPTANNLFAFAGMMTGMESWNVLDIQPELNAPYIQNQNPAPGAIHISLSSLLELDILDDDLGVDPLSVILSINGIKTWQNDIEQPGFTVEKILIPKGFRYIIDPDENLPENSTIGVRVQASDLAPLPNTIDITSSFETVIIDEYPPELTNQIPSPNETNVSIHSTIALDLIDLKTGVDASSVIIRMGSDVAWRNNAPESGFSLSSKIAIPGGYRYVICPDMPLPSITLITLSVEAEDHAYPTPHSLNASYSFTTEDVQYAPVFLNAVPKPGATDVSIHSNVAFDITDANNDLDLLSVKIVINSQTAWEHDAAQAGFSGIKNSVFWGYRYSIHPLVPFPLGALIFVEIYVHDLREEPNILEASYSFQTVPQLGIGDVLNYSFEIAGDEPGEAEHWSLLAQATAEEIASFDHETPEAVEDFEEEWMSNDQFAFGFVNAVFEKAIFDVLSEALEDFEEGFSKNELFISGLTDGVNALCALYDSALEEPIEDFEEEWMDCEYFVFEFDSAPSLPALFYGLETSQPVENYEVRWKGNEGFAFSFGDLLFEAATYDEAPSEPVEDFEEMWPLVMTTL